MRQIWRYYKITVTLRLECERNNTLPFKRHCYILISTDKKFERKSAYQVIIIITWFRRQPFGSFLKSSISNMYRKVRLRQNWRSESFVTESTYHYRRLIVFHNGISIQTDSVNMESVSSMVTKFTANLPQAI